MIPRLALITATLALFAATPAHAVRVGWHDQAASVNPVLAPQVYTHAHRIGARTMRLIVLWDQVQPSQKVYNWAGYDLAVNNARAQGFSVQLVLGGTGRTPPAWAMTAPYGSERTPAFCGRDEGCQWRKMNTRAYMQFVKAAARHFKGRVKLWSLLNEADITGYPAERYGDLYVRARRAIRRVDPRSRLLFGEFSPNSPQSYTKRALDTYGRTIKADGFAVHPYDGAHAKAQGGLQNMDAIRAKLVSWGGRKRKALRTQMGKPLPLYFTEFGCPIENGDTECVLQWQRVLSVAVRLRVRQLVAYQILDSDAPAWNTSLINAEGQPRPAVATIRVHTGKE